MVMKRWDGAAYQDITIVKRWDGAAWVDCTIYKRWDGAAWVDIALPGGGGGGGGGSLTVNKSGDADGNLLVPHAGSKATELVTSNSVTITPSGGTGPYTYAWNYVSGSTSPAVSSSTAAVVTFSATLFRNTSASSVWRCTATDSLSATGFVDVNVFLSYDTDA